jgi:transposase
MKFTASKLQLRAIFAKLEKAAEFGDFPLFLRTQGLLLVLQEGLGFDAAAQYVKRSGESLRQWVAAFFEHGIDSLKIKTPVGRQPKLTKAQCKELKGMISGSPMNFDYSSGCWNSAMICDLIERRFKVKFSVKYLPELLRRIGLSYQKAKFFAAKADDKKRAEWMQKTWPKVLSEAKKKNSMILFGDEASFALWGSLGYTWSPKGEQPLVYTNGNRKNIKVFGVIDFFTGKFIHQMVDGKLNGDSYVKFLRKVLRETAGHLILVQDGASYHRSKSLKSFILENSDRLSVYQLPSYSPDFNPIEFVWRKLKRAAIHNVYFESFEELTNAVRLQLRRIKSDAASILDLMGVYTKLKA